MNSLSDVTNDIAIYIYLNIISILTANILHKVYSILRSERCVFLCVCFQAKKINFY